MSADVLRRAAKVLREHAEHLPGAMADRPWRVVQSDSENMDGVAACSDEVHADPEGSSRACTACWDLVTPHWRAASYIALMHPPVALAVAAYLEASAPIVGSYVGTQWEPHTERLAREPLAIARAILREPGGGDVQ